MTLNLDTFYPSNIWWRWSQKLRTTLAQHSKVAATPRGGIEYTLLGKGPVILGLHGSPGGYDQALFTFREILESGEFSMLAVSRPGYGRTPINVGRSPEEQADALIELLDYLKISNVAIMSVSGGGPAAIQLALRHPGRVWALGLNAAVTKSYKYKASNTLSDKVLRSSFGMWFFNFLARYFTRQLALIMLDELSTYSKEEQQQCVDELCKDPCKIEFIRRLASSSAPWSFRKEGLFNDEKEMAKIGNWPLENISAPTLIIHGICDGDVNIDHAYFAADKIPKVKKVIREKGFHLLELGSDYEDLVQCRLNFLRENVASAH
jgi:pimeloyl-ACP methyl ester carboxylesterase